MLKCLRLLFVFFSGVISVFAGTKEGAARIFAEHRLAVLEWEQKVNAARSLEEKSVLMKAAPDGKIYGKRMIAEIGPNLNEAWTLPHTAWLLRTHSGLTIKDLKFMIDYVERHHMKSEELGQFAVSLVGAGETDAVNAAGVTAMKIRFLEKILSSDALAKGEQGERQKGEAALGLSMLLGGMGEGLNMNERRLKLLKLAIINAADSKVGDVTVADLAKEELYRLTKLTKGRVAPDLVGVDALGAPMKLSDFRGKVVMLVFWSSWELGAETLEYLRKSETARAGKPFQIIGVNRNESKDLKNLAQLGKLPGRHFSDPAQNLFGVYRVNVSPYCFILDKEGKVQFSGQVGSFADLTADAFLSKP